MNCPRCAGMVLAERERDGIVVDTCPQCRGVWLDRGELERLQARALAEFEAAERDRSWSEPARPRVEAAPPVGGPYGAPAETGSWRRRDDDDDDEDDDRRRGYGHGYGPGQGHGAPPRRGGWRSLFELFD